MTHIEEEIFKELIKIKKENIIKYIQTLIIDLEHQTAIFLSSKHCDGDFGFRNDNHRQFLRLTERITETHLKLIAVDLYDCDLEMGHL